MCGRWVATRSFTLAIHDRHAGAVQVPVDQWPAIEAQLASALSGSSRSSRPAIHGMTAAQDAEEAIATASEVRGRLLARTIWRLGVPPLVAVP